MTEKKQDISEEEKKKKLLELIKQIGKLIGDGKEGAFLSIMSFNSNEEREDYVAIAGNEDHLAKILVHMMLAKPSFGRAMMKMLLDQREKLTHEIFPEKMDTPTTQA